MAVNLTIDSKEISVPEGTTVLEAARKMGLDIPSLCYDPRLEPFGACRLCFVEVEGAKGPLTACSTVVDDGMVVKTNSEEIYKIRRLALELLLADHYGDCSPPCNMTCPAGVDIQGFIAYIADGQHEQAADLVRQNMPFPASVGRVCPAFCQDECRRQLVEEHVSICNLHRFAGDVDLESAGENLPAVEKDTGKKVAIIGGGPAGLAGAYYLRQRGHQVVIYEKEKELGGFMRYGIPRYRLPKKDVLDKEINHILNLGVDYKTNMVLGKDFTIASLRDEYDAVFVSIGAQMNRFLDLKCGDIPGFYSGVEFLRDIAYGQEVQLGKRVAVVGGGNTAMDAARTALRLGCDVTVVYRRTRNEMPAEELEIEEAEEEGVKFRFLTNPNQIYGESSVESLECIEMELGEPDESGRRRPVAVEGSDFTIDVDSVILAVGQDVEEDCLTACQTIDTDKWGSVDACEETMTTSAENVFAAGDCITGPSTVVEAIGMANKAVESIDKYLKGEPIEKAPKPYNAKKGELDELDPAEFEEYERLERMHSQEEEPEVRKDNFEEYNKGFEEFQARRETERCLSCGCEDVYDCRLKDLATRYHVQEESITKLMKKQAYPISEDHPYIKRDPNKCVLCGNCVRICEEVQGLSALGMVNRGFDTVVKPALELPLDDTPCDSCGQCISSCPTGALVSRVELEKPGPFETEAVDSICPHCGIGCSIELHTAGHKLAEVRAPAPEVGNGTVNNGNLCSRGSFELSLWSEDERLNKACINSGGELKEVEVTEAVGEAAEKIKNVLSSNGSDTVAVLVSPKLALEEALAAKKLAEDVMGTGNYVTTAPVATDIIKTLDNKNLLLDYDAVSESDFILMCQVDLDLDHPVMDNKVRKAVEKGTTAVSINNKPVRLEDEIDYSLRLSRKNTRIFLEALDKCMNSKGEELKDAVMDASQKLSITPHKLYKVIKGYIEAENPVVICDGTQVTGDELKLVNEKALVLQPEGNSRGFMEAGIKSTLEDFIDVVNKIEGGQIKALLAIVAEDDELPEGLDLLESDEYYKVVITPGLDEDTKNADVILPGADHYEKKGTFINSEGKKQQAFAALTPPAGKETWEVINELAAKLDKKIAGDYEELSREIEKL